MQEISKTLSPKLDVVFKSIFSKKGNEDLLEDFLSSILGKKVKCKEVVKEARIGQERPDEKYGALDIKIMLETAEEIDVEMQVIDRGDIINRSIFYMSLLTSQGLSISQEYSEMRPKIVIFLLDFNLFKYDDILNQSYLCLKNHKEYEISNLQKYYFIELTKIEELGAKSLMRLKKWIAFLNQDKELLEMEKNDKIIKKAQAELEYLTGDDEVKRLAELRQKAIRDELASKRLGKEEGIKEGMEKGMKAGIKEGMKQAAKNMLLENMDLITIEKVTGLSENEIKELS